MSSKNDNHSTTGDVPDIVEMSFAQMEGQCYKFGTKGHLSNTCTKDVPTGQWYINKMKAQEAQLMQTSGATTRLDNHQSTVTGTTPTTNGLSSQGTTSQEANRPADPQKWNHLYPQIHANQQVHV